MFTTTKIFKVLNSSKFPWTQGEHNVYWNITDKTAQITKFIVENIKLKFTF